MSNAKFNLRNAYLYLVCLITLIIFIVSSIQAVNNLMDVVLAENNYYETYEIYKQRYIIQDTKTENGNIQEKSEEEIKAEYDKFVETQKTRERNRNTKNFVSSIFAMFISGGFWLYHWRKIQSEKE